MTGRMLARVAALLAVAAAVVGRPEAPAALSEEAAQALVTSGGAMSALELARRLRDRRAGLRILDLRDAQAFDEFHLPTAERVDPVALLRAPPPPGDTLVLYGEGVVAAQLWPLLTWRGAATVRWLDGGVGAWFGTVVDPVLPSDATEEQVAAWPSVRQVSQYFGGTPHRGGPSNGSAPVWWAPASRNDGKGDLAAAITAARRRGCAF